MLLLIIVFYGILPITISKCYFSAFYISEPPLDLVDCNFSKGNFCYAKASLENSSHFRYGCDTSKQINEEVCDYQKNCSNFDSVLCCCKSNGCNHISDKYGANEEFENVTFVSKIAFAAPLRPPDRRHLNYVTVSILIVASIACIITYIPVMMSIRSSIESLKETEEFYIEQVEWGAAAVKTAKKVNKLLRETLFLEELLFRLNTLRRFEELSHDTFVLQPRQKNIKVLHKLENDLRFRHLIEAYTVSRVETIKRRAIIRRRLKYQRNSE